MTFKNYKPQSQRDFLAKINGKDLHIIVAYDKALPDGPEMYVLMGFEKDGDGGFYVLAEGELHEVTP